jgi:arylsulfatase A
MKSLKTKIWLLGIALCIGFCQPGLCQKNTPPNVVYILVDDLGYGDINLDMDVLNQFNNPNIKTPNLARLARESIVFTNHYAASPVCSPSRAGLLTGRIPTRSNINLYISDLQDDDKHFLHGWELTIPEVLKTRGYQTAIFGKWHLNGADWEKPENWTGWTGSFPKQQGFDHGLVAKEDPHFTRVLRVNTQKHPGDFFTVDGQPVGVIKGYTSDIITNSAINWLAKERQNDAPFFLYLPYDAVHIRVAAADIYEEMFNTGDARRDAYYANITHLDAAIGRFIDYLDSAGLSDNAVVFFSSDNGPDVWRQWDATYFCYGTSYPLNGQKYQLWEGGIRVPGMVRWTGKIDPRVSDQANSTLDVLPTLSELAGAALPNDRSFDGVSLADHLLKGKPVERRKPLYWQFDYPRSYEQTTGTEYRRMIDGRSQYNPELQPRAALRSEEFLLLGYSNAAFAAPTSFELYNLQTDPAQLNDLSNTFPDKTDQLKKQLLEVHRQVQEDRLKIVQKSDAQDD